jgi:hypothetical protein
VNSIRLAIIVEGHGEREAVPVLIRRIAAEINPALSIEICSSQRIPETKLLKADETRNAIEYAARKIGGKGGIVIIVDCDRKNGCPAKDGPALLKRANKIRPDVPISVILAKKEFESWFIAAAASIRGKRGLSSTLEEVADPESIRGAKEWLSDRMPPHFPYSETTDQPALTALFDMALARKRSGSFDKCYREIEKLLQKFN